MTQAENIPAWIALFLGLYSLAAGVGELRNPGMWQKMTEDFASNGAVVFLTGIMCIGFGGAIYLASPWQQGDWLSILISLVGGFMIAEGAVLIAMGDRLIGVWKRFLGEKTGIWAGLSALIGAGLIFAALSRLQTV